MDKIQERKHDIFKEAGLDPKTLSAEAMIAFDLFADWIQEKFVEKEKVREAVRTIGIMEVRKKLNAILEGK